MKDLELRPVLAGAEDCPHEAVHGTYLSHWTSIQQHGLSRMQRNHIHLRPAGPPPGAAPGEQGGVSGESLGPSGAPP